MKISLGKKGDYSVRVVLDLARNYRGGRRKGQEIAAAMTIPKKYVLRILADLVRSGLITATAGRDGGYELARSPSTIRMLDVVEAAEGPIELRVCLLRGIPCASEGICAVHETWREAQDAMMRRLRRTSFAQIVGWESKNSGSGSKGRKRKRSLRT